MKSIRDAREELALKIPILEAEVVGLRQLLTEVKANRERLRQEMDDLRRDRDHWQKLAERGGPTLSGEGRGYGFAAEPRQAPRLIRPPLRERPEPAGPFGVCASDLRRHGGPQDQVWIKSGDGHDGS